MDNLPICIAHACILSLLLSHRETFAKCVNPSGVLGNRCFQYYPLSETYHTWEEARIACVGFGGKLVQIPDKETDVFIWQLIQKSKVRAGSTYLGCTDKETEGKFKWTDGSAVTYTNWDPGEPDNFEGKQHCCKMRKLSNVWNDGYCTTDGAVSGYVCQLTAHKPNHYTAKHNTSMVTPGGSALMATASVVECAAECANVAGCGGYNVCGSGGVMSCEVVTSVGTLADGVPGCAFYARSVADGN